MPKSKQAHAEYMRRKRLEGRLCQTCGLQPAAQHYQAHSTLRAIAVCLLRARGIVLDPLTGELTSTPEGLG